VPADLVRPGPRARKRAAVPILALDVPTAADADALLRRVPDAEWVKVGLQLFTAEGPPVVRALVAASRRVFLDLKLHDIPNTVAGAVGSAAGLGAELLTVHASGGRAMLSAASAAAERSGALRLLAVTVLTSLQEREVAEAWGRGEVSAGAEAVRLAALARDCGIDGVVCSVHEAAAIRRRIGGEALVLTPGIRLPDAGTDDQARTASPRDAVAAGADFLVIGRTVSGAADPAAAWASVVEGINDRAAE
jgi:orotidine-5'-phosphate decarboxylase